MNPEVHKIYIKRIGFSLIRVHRQQLYTSNQSSESLLLQQLKWPIEYMFVGMKVKDYHAGSTSVLKRTHLDKWHTFHQRSEGTYNTDGQLTYREDRLVVTSVGTESLGIGQAVFTASSENRAVLTTGVADDTTATTLLETLSAGDLIKVNGVILTVAVGAAAGASPATVEVHEGVVEAVTDSVAIAQGARRLVAQGMAVTTAKCTKTMNNLTVKAHGINIYNNFPEGFFNSYLPYTYGGPNVNTPEDCGAYFIPFCLYPGTYQPSGHINVSRAREFYLDWDSSVITSGTEGTLVVIASAINWTFTGLKSNGGSGIVIFC